MLSGAALLQAEAAAALSAPELGLLKAKRSLLLLSTRMDESAKSAADGRKVEVRFWRTVAGEYVTCLYLCCVVSWFCFS